MPGPRLLVCLAVCALLPVSLVAQQSTSSTNPATSDPQAVAVIQKSLAALTNGVSVSDVTLTGTVRRVAGSEDETGTATVTALAVGDSKLSLNFPSGPRSELRNPASTSPSGVAAGAWSGPDGTLHAMAAQNLFTDATWFFPAFTAANLISVSQGYVLTYGGLVTHDGQNDLRVSAAEPFPSLAGGPAQPLMQHLTRMDLYFDPSSFLPVALAFDMHPDNDASTDIPAEILFSDYQTVSGATIPMRVQQFLNNGLDLDFQFSSAVLNSGLSASDFTIE